MTLDMIDKAGSTIDADAVLGVLSRAMGTAQVPARARVCAAAEAHSPEEGLALLGAYVTITAPAVRQAILDAVLIISRQSSSAQR